ncbi:MAG: hypothetical protein G8345_04480 [Magnetococcales bacterium]|nr:hypothetical protein [Magnetococcales bacterium]NGZ26128.1 hypothetical protein [Magnetococcales bacterium]
MSRIVVIHKDPTILALISHILQNLGHQVVTAKNNQEGRFLCMLWHPVDGVVRNISTSDSNGIEWTKLPPDLQQELPYEKQSMALYEGKPLFNKTSLFNHQTQNGALEFTTPTPVRKIA